MLLRIGRLQERTQLPPLNDEILEQAIRRGPSVIVADTNLIAYLMIRSDQTPAAQGVLRKDSVWAAPLLWRSEFRNVLALYLRQGYLSLANALQYMEESEALLQGREYEVPSAPVLELSQESGCTAYDCEFVHLARELDVPLVTSGQRVLRAFPHLAVSREEFAHSPACPTIRCRGWTAEHTYPAEPALFSYDRDMT